MKKLFAAALLLIAIPIAAQTLGSFDGRTDQQVWKNGAGGHFLVFRHTDGTNFMPTGDALARAIFTQLTDATNGPVTVKAASTAPVAADKALVVNTSPNGPDPCMNPSVAKTSAVVNATGQIVALSSTKIVYVCGFYATLGGTTPTITFQYGTGSNCGTGTVALSGAFAPSPNGSEFFLGHGGTVTQTAASNALCIALGGTSPTIAGMLTYVQQ